VWMILGAKVWMMTGGLNSSMAGRCNIVSRDGFRMRPCDWDLLTFNAWPRKLLCRSAWAGVPVALAAPASAAFLNAKVKSAVLALDIRRVPPATTACRSQLLDLPLIISCRSLSFLLVVRHIVCSPSSFLQSGDCKISLQCLHSCNLQRQLCNFYQLTKSSEQSSEIIAQHQLANLVQSNILQGSNLRDWAIWQVLVSSV
jgi:hypothetical protein